MKSLKYSDQLIDTINEKIKILLSLTDDKFHSKPLGMVWTRKEILGHLIDSASNNHQRFIRIQDGENPFNIIQYSQDNWVKRNNYANQSSDTVINLWYYYNTHLAHVIRNIPEHVFDTKCILKENSEINFEFIVSDYIRHLDHHLEQIFS